MNAIWALLNHAICLARAIVLLAALCLFAFFMLSAGSSELPSWSMTLVFVLVAANAGLLLAAHALSTFILAREQPAIDQAALNAAHSGGDYYLYLRSFSFDHEIRVRDDTDVGRRRTCGANLGRVVFQSYIATALRDGAPTVGIGRARYSSGMTSYPTTDENWRETFDRLAEGAVGIFLLPSLTQGSQHEIAWVLERPDMMEKTVFIIPPMNCLTRDAKTQFLFETQEFLTHAIGDDGAGYFDPRVGGMFRLGDNDPGYEQRGEPPWVLATLFGPLELKNLRAIGAFLWAIRQEKKTAA